MKYNINMPKVASVVRLIVAVLLFAAPLIFVSAERVNAINCPDGGKAPTVEECRTVTNEPVPSPVQLEEASEFEIDCDPPQGTELNRTNCGIINLIVIAINFLSAIAGIVFVASIMISGYQYMTARDNAGQLQKAKSRIAFTMMALVIYIFMYALLNYLVPGGVVPQ